MTKKNYEFWFIVGSQDLYGLNCTQENGHDDFRGATCSQTTTIPQGKKTLRALGHIVNKTAGLLLAQRPQLITQGVE